MAQNRWVQPPTDRGGGPVDTSSRRSPRSRSSTDPTPTSCAPSCRRRSRPRRDAKVHLRFTDIDLDFGSFRWQEKVGWFGVDVTYEGLAGEYPLLIPIDLEKAVAISRERHGEPKKLAEITIERDGDDVRASMTRHGVTFAEVVGTVTGARPCPSRYDTRQFWFKFMPAVPAAASTATCCSCRSTRSARR